MPPPPDLPPLPSLGWITEQFETREVRKAQERADRAARRADRAARRVREAQERAAGRRTGAQQIVDAVGDAATAALTVVSAAAEEKQAKLAAKARMRELEHAVVTTRAGGRVDVTPPTRDEALKLVDQLDPTSSGASLVRGLGFVVAGIVALAMMVIGGFGWLGVIVPVLILIAGGALGDKIRAADRGQKAAHVQLELARASLGATEPPRQEMAQEEARRGRPGLIEKGDPRTGAEVVAVLDRLIANVAGRVPEPERDVVRRIRDKAALALPATDAPLDLTDHDVWLLRQICIDYVPGALDHYIALPSKLTSEPMLDGRSAREVLDEQLDLIESRLDEMVTRTYQREAGGLLTHGRFVADSLRTDPFQARLTELVTNSVEPGLTTKKAVVREREEA